VEGREEHLERLLRAAAALGIFNRDPNTLHFSLNDISKELLDGPGSFKFIVLHNCEPPAVKAWLALDQSIQHGIYAYGSIFDKDTFDFYQHSPESQERFNKAMTGYSMMWNVGQALNAVYDFKSRNKIVDVGGGCGALVVQLLQANPHLSGTIFDLSSVIEDARTLLHSHQEVHSRIELVAGDFFETVPTGGDVYLMKSITHDWNDQKSIEILTTVHKAIPKHGKLLVIDRVIQEIGDLGGSLTDLHMLTMVNGKERTEKQFQHIFSSAGLKINRFIPLPPTPYYAIEGEKI